jgi:hypothetical protein
MFGLQQPKQRINGLISELRPEKSPATDGFLEAELSETAERLWNESSGTSGGKPRGAQLAGHNAHGF